MKINKENSKPIAIITIDGASGVGKGSIASLLALHLGFNLLDSGALYRIIATYIIKNGLDPECEKDIREALSNSKIHFEPPYIYLNAVDVSKQIRTEECGQVASKLAVYPFVRQQLQEIMKSFVIAPGLVADGRDMGTSVFKEAQLKIFLTASDKKRAKRRYKQLKEKKESANIEQVYLELIARDKRDIERTASPLKPAADAFVLNTNDLELSEVFELVKHLTKIKGILPCSDLS